MLRTTGMNGPRRNFVRYATFGIVALLGVAAAGLRGPGSGSSNEALAQSPAVENAPATVERIGLESVPNNAILVVSVRPTEIVASGDFDGLVDLIDETRPLKKADISLRDWSEVLLITYSGAAYPGRLVIRFAASEKLQPFLQSLGMEKRPDGAWQSGRDLMRQIDESTLVYDAIWGIPEEKLPPLMNREPRWAAEWEQRKEQPVVVVADVKGMRASISALKPGNLSGGLPLQMIAPLIERTDWAVASVDLSDKLGISAILRCDSNQAASQVSETLKAVAVLLKNVAREQAAVVPPGGKITTLAMVKKISQEAENVLDKPQVEVDGDRVRVALESQLSAQEIAKLVTALLPTVEEARQAERRNQEMNNLKQIALAMHNYHDTRKAFPPAASYTHRKNGLNVKSEYPHSWRVAILPYIEYSNLYDQYHFDEPWDSKANKQVLEQMPVVFRSSRDDADSTNTSYFVLTGPGTLFDDETGTQFREIRDGTSKTLLLVEAKRPVPWTKPEDIPYAADEPVPQLGGWVPGQFLAARADGSVVPVSTDVDEATLRLWIVKDDKVPSPELSRKQ